MEFSQFVQIGIGALIVLIVLFMVVENVAIPPKLATAKVRNEDEPGSRSGTPRT